MCNHVFLTKYQALCAYLRGDRVYFADSETDKYPAYFTRHEGSTTADAEKWFNELVIRFRADLNKYGKGEKIYFYLVDTDAE